MKYPSHPLKLTHFRLIDAVATHGQLSRAAEVMAITQPAASRMLSEIEALIGAPLFERRSKGMEPTELGVAVARRAQALSREMQDIAREVEELKAGSAGEVHVGAVTGAAVGFVVGAITKLQNTHPQVQVHAAVAPSRALITRLMAREFDFVLSRIPLEMDATLFHARSAWPERVAFLAHRSHPLARLRNIGTAQLAAWPWVVQPAGTPIREALTRAFLAEGVTPPTKLVNTTSLMMVAALLGRTQSIAPLAREVADLFAGPGVTSDLVALDLAQEVTIAPYSLVSLRDRALSPAAARMYAMIGEAIAAPIS
ncbi:LysR family transcriptional regulator [Phaeovulum sp. W22_SRMD_FR3]|uniref:LysR family transcriptional regulator n=1 Tax=Phaeovulum sp. W22_SRMD_FR3 TaxID=3240274 RepID=UPI003F98E3EC